MPKNAAENACLKEQAHFSLHIFKPAVKTDHAISTLKTVFVYDF